MDALRWSDSVRHPGFYIDMRLGKCLLTIRRVRRWHCEGPYLIICPDSAIQGWLDAIEEEIGLPPVEISGSRNHRLRILKNLIYNFWYVTNKECHRSTPEIKEIPWDVVVFDESRFIANPKSNMSKFYVENFRDVNHRIILTGTPDYRDSLDYYQQLRFLDYNSLPYKNFWDFRTTAFFHEGYDFILKKKHDLILKNALAKYTYIINRDDVEGGRTHEYIKHTFRLPRKLRKEYDTIEEEFIFEKQDMKTIFATQAHIWLMRLCGGFINDKFVWDNKLKKLIELLKYDLKNEQVVVLCRFKREVYKLNNFFTRNYIEKEKWKSCAFTGDIQKILRRKIIKNFNEKKLRVLFAHPAAISHGTDLSSATSIIFYSQPSGGEVRDQSEKRIFTMSDEKHTLIIDLLTKGTVDEDTRLGHINQESRREIFNRAVKRCQKN